MNDDVIEVVVEGYEHVEAPTPPKRPAESFLASLEIQGIEGTTWRSSMNVFTELSCDGDVLVQYDRLCDVYQLRVRVKVGGLIWEMERLYDGTELWKRCRGLWGHHDKILLKIGQEFQRWALDNIRP